MHRTTWGVFLTVAALACTCFAQDKPDFSGTWKLNFGRSDFGPSRAVFTQTDVIQQKGQTIKVTVAFETEKEKRQFTVTLVTDGKEIEVPKDVREPGVTSQNDASSWEGAVLVVHHKDTYGSSTVTSVSRYTLSPDGKALTLSQDFTTQNGAKRRTLVFDRADSATPSAMVSPAAPQATQDCEAECRERIAQIIQTSFQQNNIDVQVSVTGDNNEIITFDSAKLFGQKENRLAGKDALLEKKVMEVLCSADFRKAIIGPSASRPTYGDEFDLNCSETPRQKLSTDSAPSGNNFREGTLNAVRKEYLGKRIIIKDTTIPGRGVLVEWTLANHDNTGRFASSIYDHLAATYNGKEATVIAVQLDAIDRKKSGVNEPNALGETLSEGDIDNPYFDVVGRFDDGTVAMVTGYPTTIESAFLLAAARNNHEQIISANLPRAVGKTVYAVGYSQFYRLDTTRDEIVDLVRREQKRVYDFPLLQPLTIADAKYIADADVVVMKIRLPNGTQLLAESEYHDDESKDGDNTFLGRITRPRLMTVIPPELTSTEVQSIQQGAIFRGMTQEALYYAMGFPTKENDSGSGGKQLIYHDVVFVYVDSDGKVSDWQSVDKP